MSYYQFNYNLFSKSCDGYESDNNLFFQSCNDYDHAPVDAQRHNYLIDSQSFTYNNCNFGFQKEENNIFEDFQKISKENNQTFKKSIGNKSTGLSEMNDKKGEKIKFLSINVVYQKIVKEKILLIKEYILEMIQIILKEFYKFII